MTVPQFFDPAPGGGGSNLGRAYYYSHAVRVGNLIQTAGQGGYSDPDGTTFPEALEDEIAQCFQNIEAVLNAAGSSWRDVIGIRAFHGGPEGFTAEADEIVGTLLRKWVPDHRPTWTGIGVQLAGRMRIEIEVVAVVPDEA
ncbi:Rid family hydrolase [Microbacterium sp. X-17]|uniref:Rid family hydrolase n=1 Tax=Microbacterium sp. X-17 TaxID=3144404 RepID=UPI0031F4CEB5